MDNERIDLEFLTRRKMSVMDFVNGSGLSEFIGDLNPGIYLSYPDFFFKTIFKRDLCFSSEEINKFSLASFLMYDFLIQFDDLIDHSLQSLTSEYLSPLVGMHNLSQRLLSDLFSFHSEFWKIYLDRQKSFIDLAIYESTLCTENFRLAHYSKNFKIEDYHEYFLKKCSFSRLTIDGLYLLNQKRCNEFDYKNLLKFNDHFNLAFCILDDIEDFNKDIGKKQLNSAHHFVVSRRKMNNNVILDDFLKDSIEWFYTKGIAANLISMAEYELHEAKKIANFYNDNGYLNILVDFKINDLNNKRRIISDYTILK
jgi:hypothetical protein